MQQIKYFQTAWGDIKNSPGWFGKLCLLGLLNLIPIFGQIVTYGYVYGWAREIAWGVRQPLPQHIFSNEDGKFYRRGWFILVLFFVIVGVIPGIVGAIGGSMQGVETVSYQSGVITTAYTGGPLAVLGSIISFASTLLTFFLCIIAWIGSMRISIYDRLSAGFQIRKIWQMFRHDTNGAMRIFGMYLLVGLIIGVIMGILISILIMFVAFAGMAGLASSGTSLQSLGHMSETQAIQVGVQILMSAGLVGVIGFIIVLFAGLLGTVFIEVLVARAMGYWTAQFDVPHWHGQDDLMPFEIAPAQTYQPPVNPSATAAGFTQQTGQQAPYQQPVQQQASYQQPMQQQAPYQQPVQQAPYQQPVQQQAPYQQPQGQFQSQPQAQYQSQGTYQQPMSNQAVQQYPASAAQTPAAQGASVAAVALSEAPSGQMQTAAADDWGASDAVKAYDEQMEEWQREADAVIESMPVASVSPSTPSDVEPLGEVTESTGTIGVGEMANPSETAGVAAVGEIANSSEAIGATDMPVVPEAATDAPQPEAPISGTPLAEALQTDVPLSDAPTPDAQVDAVKPDGSGE